METDQIANMDLKLKKLWLLLLLNCCCISLFAQWPAEYKTRDSIIEKSIYNLRKKGVDTIAVYSRFGSLSLLPNCRSDQFPNYNPNKDEPCSWKDTFLIFILWKKNGQSFFTFRTRCYDYPVKPVHDAGLWNYYLVNRVAIENSKPKEPWLKHVNLQTEEVTFGKDEISYKENENNQLIFLVGHYKTVKNTGYRLYQKFGNGGDQNLNYEYNINLPDEQLRLKLEVLCRPLVISRELTVATKN